MCAGGVCVAPVGARVCVAGSMHLRPEGSRHVRSTIVTMSVLPIRGARRLDGEMYADGHGAVPVGLVCAVWRVRASGRASGHSARRGRVILLVRSREPAEK